jgi:hypothetical protein
MATAGVSRSGPLAALELPHQPAQKRVQVSLLVLRQRCGDQRLVRGLGTQPLLPLAVAFGGELDEHAAPVVRIGAALDEPGVLHPVEPVRHGAARELGALGDGAGGLSVRRAAQTKVRQNLPLAEA